MTRTNAVFESLRHILFGNGRASSSAAKSRLSFVLVQDRTGLTNDELAAFKKELVGVIEKYFVIDEQGFDINYKRETDTTTLLINSPIIVRRQEGGPKGVVGAKHSKKNAEPVVTEATEEAAAGA